MIFKSILVPVDGSPPSNAAVTLAVAMAKDANASLAFCHAFHVPRPSHDAGGFAREQIVSEETEATHVILDAARKQASAAGIDAKALSLQDPVGEAILDAVAQTGADLIVMGCHGRSGIVEAILGSKTAEVIKRSKIPVLVAPHVPG
jgi:nucleotide-binding universal stress UspA family protein